MNSCVVYEDSLSVPAIYVRSSEQYVKMVPHSYT